MPACEAVCKFKLTSTTIEVGWRSGDCPGKTKMLIPNTPTQKKKRQKEKKWKGWIEQMPDQQILLMPISAGMLNSLMN